MNRAERRRADAEKQRRYRERLKQRRIAVLVPVNEAVINFLVRTGWLTDRDSHKRELIAQSISRMIEEAEQHRYL